MSVAAVHQDQVRSKIEQCYSLAETHFSRSFRRPTVSYDLHSDTIVGRAHWIKYTIQLNPQGFTYDLDDMINDTIPHEIAHLVAIDVHGVMIKSHGVEWRQIAKLFGATPRAVSHKRTLPINYSRTPHKYVCVECNHEIGISHRRHTSRNTPCLYVCPVCAGSMLYSVTVSTSPSTPQSVSSTSKLKLCEKLFLDNAGMTRQQYMSMFVSTAGCTTAGASTYYSNLKKKYG